VNRLTEISPVKDTATHLEKRLECPTCSTLELYVTATAIDRTPIRCGRCGDYLGRLYELAEAVRPMG